MTGTFRFGRPEAFEVRLAWTEDPDPVATRPARHGWSWGRLQLVAHHRSLTTLAWTDRTSPYVEWYLSPVLHWLADHWAALTHEEVYPWRTRLEHVGGAAAVTRRALERHLPAAGDEAVETWETIQRWYTRHALRAAASGGLFPDLFVRRRGNGIELSWTGAAPEHAPHQLGEGPRAGHLVLPLRCVAQPLWTLLKTITAHPPTQPDLNTEDWETLRRKVQALEALETEPLLETCAPDAEAQERIHERLSALPREDLMRCKREPDLPVITDLPAGLLLPANARTKR